MWNISLLLDEPISQGSSKPQFSTLEVVGGAACTGLEVGLLLVALRSLLPSPGISMGLWGMIRTQKEWINGGARVDE